MGKLKTYILATAGLVILGGAFTVIGPYVVQGQGGGNPAQHAALSQQLDDVLEVVNDLATSEQLASISQQLDDVLEAVNNISTNGDLRGVTQNWDRKLDSTNGEADGCNSDRFTCVLDGRAVRDNETGLVWERDPGQELHEWTSAIIVCIGGRDTGGVKGWHLPMITQLTTMVDASTPAAGPKLPLGHPFLTVLAADYWSATTSSNRPTDAWEVRFANGNVGDSGKSSTRRAWCVRGGQGFDGQDNVAAITATHNLD